MDAVSQPKQQSQTSKDTKKALVSGKFSYQEYEQMDKDIDELLVKSDT